MLSSSARLRRQRDIIAVVRRGKTWTTPAVRAHLLHGATSGQRRVACVVSKKISALAVRRHLYQRWLRECAQRLLPLLPVGTDMVLIAQPGIKKADNWKTVYSGLEGII